MNHQRRSPMQEMIREDQIHAEVYCLSRLGHVDLVDTGTSKTRSLQY